MYEGLCEGMCVFKQCKCVNVNMSDLNSHGRSDSLHHVEEVHGFGLIMLRHHQDPVLEWDLTEVRGRGGGWRVRRVEGEG